MLGQFNSQSVQQGKRQNYMNQPRPSHIIPSSNNESALSRSLPSGWKREESIQRNGLSTGKTEVYYTSPKGLKVRTKHEMKSILGDAFDLTTFDWRSGDFIIPPAKSRRLDDPTVSSGLNPDPFVRRTSPPETLKPVVIRSHPDCKRTDSRSPQHDAPRQLFWEKRFTDACAVDSQTGEPFKSLTLPRAIQNAGAPGYTPTQLVQSLVSAIATKTGPITGQEQQPNAIEKNPCIAVNPLQPMIKTYIVSDDDVRRQEARIKELRKKLEMARKRLNPVSLK